MARRRRGGGRRHRLGRPWAGDGACRPLRDRPNLRSRRPRGDRTRVRSSSRAAGRRRAVRDGIGRLGPGRGRRCPCRCRAGSLADERLRLGHRLRRAGPFGSSRLNGRRGRPHVRSRVAHGEKRPGRTRSDAARGNKGKHERSGIHLQLLPGCPSGEQETYPGSRRKIARIGGKIGPGRRFRRACRGQCPPPRPALRRRPASPEDGRWEMLNGKWSRHLAWSLRRRRG